MLHCGELDTDLGLMTAAAQLRDCIPSTLINHKTSQVRHLSKITPLRVVLHHEMFFRQIHQQMKAELLFWKKKADHYNIAEYDF